MTGLELVPAAAEDALPGEIEDPCSCEGEVVAAAVDASESSPEAVRCPCDGFFLKWKRFLEGWSGEVGRLAACVCIADEVPAATGTSEEVTCCDPS